MTEYLSIDDAIVWAQEELGKSVSKGRIMNLLLDERISVHFSAEVDLHGVAIHQPNGGLQAIKVPVPFKGVLKALTPPSNGGCLTASLVEVAFVRGKGFRLERQATVAGCELPTTEEHGGCILPGYGVEAILDFAPIPREEWLICTDDLRALFEERGEVNDSTQKKGVLASGGLMDDAVPSSPIESWAVGGRCLEVGYDQGGSTQPAGTAVESVREDEPYSDAGGASSASRARFDDIQIEIDDIVAAMRRGGISSVSPAAVMARLKERAGRRDSCISEAIDNGVLWIRGSSGVKEKLTTVALKSRIRRRIVGAKGALKVR